MKRSDRRILTSHVGSLIRPPELLDAVRAKQAGKMDEAAYQIHLQTAVAGIVKQQAAAGVDVVSDGEFGKSISWSQYALERLSGFERRPIKPNADPWARGADRTRFAEFYTEMDAKEGRASMIDAICVGPIKYSDAGLAEVKRDIENFKAGLKGVKVEEAFLPVAAPSSVIPDRKNEYYKNDDDILQAIAEAMRTEYRAIVDAGFIVQLDDARAAVTYDRMVPPGSFDDYYKWLGKQVEVMNHALDGIPEEKVRYHVCWGSWPGPHVTDVPLKKIVDQILKVKAGAYLIENANPRHEHEWKVWEDVKMPKGRILAPGVISHATNVVEHPELIAQRITRLAKLLGRENVIASTDCGFAQSTFYRRVHPSIMWAKLEALAEGAKLASKELWK
jgi:5-methyltetrahydropteroyltriglutamate--homocysteine methyltransferase